MLQQRVCTIKTQRKRNKYNITGITRNISNESKYDLTHHYHSLPYLIISTISSVVTVAFKVGVSKGEYAIFSGIKAKVRPSFLRIITFPVLSACFSTIASFCLASEYENTCILDLHRIGIEILSRCFELFIQRQKRCFMF